MSIIALVNNKIAMGATSKPIVIIPIIETISKLQAIIQTRLTRFFQTANAPIHDRKNTATGQNSMAFDPCLGANSKAVTV